jgi:hypothetical protein
VIQQNKINYVKVLGMIRLIIICHEDEFELQNERDMMVQFCDCQILLSAGSDCRFVMVRDSYMELKHLSRYIISK